MPALPETLIDEVRSTLPTSPAGSSAADTRVCTAQAIHVVNPQTLKIEKNITVDQTGAPLTNAQNESRTWNDVAFVEVPCSQPQPVQSWLCNSTLQSQRLS